MGGALRIIGDRYPKWFQEKINELAEVSADLASKRALAITGWRQQGRARANSSGWSKRRRLSA